MKHDRELLSQKSDWLWPGRLQGQIFFSSPSSPGGHCVHAVFHTMDTEDSFFGNKAVGV